MFSPAVVFKSLRYRLIPPELEKKRLKAALETAGYLQPLQIPVEPGVPSYGNTQGDHLFGILLRKSRPKMLSDLPNELLIVKDRSGPVQGWGSFLKEKDDNNG